MALSRGLGMMRVGYPGGLRARTRASSSGCTKTTRQSVMLRKLTIQAVYCSWLCFEGIL